MNMRIEFTRSHRPQGFSLAESLISIGIASSVLVTVIGLMAGTLSGMRDAKAEMVAGLLASQVGQEIRSLSDLALPGTPRPGASEIIVIYDDAMQILQHSERNGLGGVGAAYAGGASDVSAMWIVRARRVVLAPAVNEWMDKLELTVESPASAPENQRLVKRYDSVIPKI